VLTAGGRFVMLAAYPDGLSFWALALVALREALAEVLHFQPLAFQVAVHAK
jgi:hypothetical protein